ncbi:serine hydrolase domain-containing protein [Larkinella humicola]|uniref:Beta-lactamase family protein n=1 Tax=Larkinella humicola TaxID=2607654 RepID=A0A5N1J6X2_9BACT|nr:serine hydrolase domain-containing protein [Larkinella humicola]KAA9340363.1 beta-lactamase family protein [Larkinella humicola]
MKSVYYLLLLTGWINSLQAQDPLPIAATQAAVETHLLPTVQFADSTYQFFSLRQRMKTYGVASVSIAVIDQGRIAWAKAYGLADVASVRPATASTLYQAASISKSINAVAVQRLVKEGKLTLQTDIRAYLKSWKMPENPYSTGRRITLKHLLSHTAGMSVGGFNGYARTDTLPTLDQILDGQRPANSEAIRSIDFPGVRFRYSGGGTVMIRKIIEDQTASDYATVVSRTVLRPLAMNQSTYSQRLGNEWTDWATAYVNDQQEVVGKYTLNPELAPDGLWTTPTDLAKFVLALQQSLSGTKPDFLSRAEINELLTPVVDSNQVTPGFFLVRKGAESYFQHAGSNVGYKSNFYGSMHGGRGVVVMINGDQYDIIPEIINSVAYTYQWEGFYQPELRKLAVVSEAVLSLYPGEYHLESPSMQFRIVKQQGQLYLSSGTDAPERMYFTSAQRFFLLSSKQLNWEFAKTEAEGGYELVIHQGSERFRAKRKPGGFR